MGPLEWSDIWAPPFTANMPHSSHAALAPSSSSQTNVQPSPPSCLKLYLYFLSFGWHQWQALSDETNILTDANTKTYFSNPKKSFRLLSPSGDLGIGLVWDNLSPPDPHFSVQLFKSSANWTKLSIMGPQLFCGWYEMILDVFRCSQLFPDISAGL